MAREIKELMLAELENQFRDIEQTGCVLISYQGLKADAAMRARQTAADQGAEMTVVKNSLFTLALRRLGVDKLEGMVEGGTAVVCAENPVQAAKAARAVAGDHEAIHVKGAYAEGSLLGPDGVEKLADIPSREVLLSTFAGALLAPLRRLAGGLLAKPRAFLNVLEQLKEQRGNGEG